MEYLGGRCCMQRVSPWCTPLRGAATSNRRRLVKAQRHKREHGQKPWNMHATPSSVARTRNRFSWGWQERLPRVVRQGAACVVWVRHRLGGAQGPAVARLDGTREASA